MVLQTVVTLTVFVPIAIFFQARARLEVYNWLSMGIPCSTFFLFMLIEWGLFAMLLCFVEGRRLIGRPFVLVAMLCLTLIPFVRFAAYTDFVMRSSIPALFILSLQVIESAVAGLGRFTFRVAALWGALFRARCNRWDSSSHLSPDSKSTYRQWSWYPRCLTWAVSPDTRVMASSTLVGSIHCTLSISLHGGAHR